MFISWAIWARHKNNYLGLVSEWRDRYTNLDKEYSAIALEYNDLEAELKQHNSRTTFINDEKNKLTGKLTASKALLHKADKEIDNLKKQLGQTTAHLQVTSKELEESKQTLSSLKNTPDETQELKTLLGEATKRYNHNGIELKNKQEQYVALENKFDETVKRMNTTNKELEHLRAGLLKRDKELENQIVLFSNLQNQYDEKNKLVTVLQKEINLQKHKIEDEQKEAEISALQSELSNTNKLIPSLNEKIESYKNSYSSLENNLKKRDATIVALENEITRLSKDIPPLRDKIDSNENRIEALKQENHTLQQKIPAFQSTISARDAHIRELEIFIQDAQKAILKPSNGHSATNGNGSSNGSTNGSSKSNGHTQNSNVVHINGRANGNGKSNGHAVSNTKSSKPKMVTKNNSANGTTSTNLNGNKPRLKSYGLNKPTRKPDDLKLISGIGIALEKTLHKCGIYFFEQIAGFTRKDVSTVDDMLNFKGRIDRDEWIKQAKILIRGGTYTRKKPAQKNKPKKRRIKPLGMKRPSGELDDLQLINGVGPKLERKLHRLGVYHYEQIAEFTADDIELLDSKLKTYRGRVKRDKWPMQARRLFKEFHVNT